MATKDKLDRAVVKINTTLHIMKMVKIEHEERDHVEANLK